MLQDCLLPRINLVTDLGEACDFTCGILHPIESGTGESDPTCCCEIEVVLARVVEVGIEMVEGDGIRIRCDFIGSEWGLFGSIDLS